MNKAEKFIQDYTRNYSNEILRNGNESFTNIPRKNEYNPWLTPDQARMAVEIAREEMVEKACRGYCDDICEKGMCGMCYHKHDGEGQVKNTFKYNECYTLQILINSMKDE